MGRWVAAAAAIALGCAAAPADATVFFSSTRCADDADREARPHFFPSHGQPQCMPAIWRVEDDGSGVQRLPGSGENGRHDADPDIARDGSVLALRRGRYNGETGAFEEPNRIWVLPSTGGPAFMASPP